MEPKPTLHTSFAFVSLLLFGGMVVALPAPAAAACAITDVLCTIEGTVNCTLPAQTIAMHFIAHIAGSDVRDGPDLGSIQVNWVATYTFAAEPDTDGCNNANADCVYTIHDGNNDVVHVSKAGSLVQTNGSYRGVAFGYYNAGSQLGIYGNQGYCSGPSPPAGTLLFRGTMGPVAGLIIISGYSDGPVP